MDTLAVPFIVLMLYDIPFVYYQVFTFIRSFRYSRVRARLIEVQTLLSDPPLVSILIPTKGEDKELIYNTISKLNGSDVSRYFEFIIISDDTEDYVNELKRMLSGFSNVLVLRREKPRGFKACALQYGFERSRGKYVITLDVDSVVSPEHILEAAKYLESSGCDAVTFRWMGYTNNLNLTSLGLIISTNLVSRALFLGRFGDKFAAFPVGSGTMFKAESLRRIGGWDCNVVQDDLVVGARMIAEGMRICPLDFPIYVEVPSSLRSFIIQQSRWALGTAETLRTNGSKILGAKISTLKKVDAIWYLLQYTPIFAALLAMTYLSLVVLIYPDFSPPLWLFGLWVASIGLYGLTYFVESRELDYPEFLKIRALGRISSFSAATSFYMMVGFINGLRNRKVYKITPKGRNSTRLGRFLPKTPLILGSIMMISSLRALIMLNYISFLWLLYYGLAMIYTVYIAVKEG